MNKKIFFLFFFLVTTFSLIIAQEKGTINIENFKKNKSDYIRKELKLTEQEAKDFLPLSEELMKKKYELNKSVRQDVKSLREKKSISDAEYDAINNKMLDTQLKEAQLEKEYYQKFRKVLPAEKIYKYRRAEKNFMKKYLEGNSNHSKGNSKKRNK